MKNFKSSTQPEYMKQWESKVGSEERNTVLNIAGMNLDPREKVRLQVEKEQLTSQEIRASLYAKSNQIPENEIPLPYNKHFLVIHFGDYFTNYLGAHPAEFCIADFSIRDGLNNCFSRVLDPGAIPFGFQTEFRQAAKTNGYELPGFDPSCRFDMECLNVIEFFMQKYGTNEEEPGILYTIRTQVETVEKCLEYVAKRADREFKYKVYSLSKLVELLLIEGDHLRGLNGMDTSTMTFSEAEAISLILTSTYDEVPELGCNFHNSPIKSYALFQCSMSNVKRWIYNCLGYLTSLYSCPMYLHTHVPKFQKDGFFYIETDGGPPSHMLLPPMNRKEILQKIIKTMSTKDPPSSQLKDFGTTQELGPQGQTSTLTPQSLTLTAVATITPKREEEKIPKSAFTTHQEFPNLNELKEAGLRALEVTKYPELKEREFPKGPNSISWTIISSSKGSAKKQPTGTTKCSTESLHSILETDNPNQIHLLSFKEKEEWTFDLCSLKLKYYNGEMNEKGMVRYCPNCHSKYACLDGECFHPNYEISLSDPEDDDEFVANCNDPNLRRYLMRRVTRHTASLIPNTSRWLKREKLMEHIQGPSTMVDTNGIYSDGLHVFKLEEGEKEPIVSQYKIPLLRNKIRHRGSQIGSKIDDKEIQIRCNMTSASQSKPHKIKLDLEAKIQQAREIQDRGVFPSTKFLTTNRLFWDTEFKVKKGKIGRGGGRIFSTAQMESLDEERFLSQDVMNRPHKSSLIKIQEYLVQDVGEDVPKQFQDGKDLGNAESSSSLAVEPSEGSSIYPSSISPTASSRPHSLSALKRLENGSLPMGRGRCAAKFWEDMRRCGMGSPSTFSITHHDPLDSEFEAGSVTTGLGMPTWGEDGSDVTDSDLATDMATNPNKRKN